MFLYQEGKTKDLDCTSCYSKSRNFNFGRFFISCRCSYGQAIVENIRTERSGKTTIITTHRLSAVQHADWILVMDEGAVIEEGTHARLIQKGGWYAEQFERQQGESESADSGVKI